VLKSKKPVLDEAILGMDYQALGGGGQQKSLPYGGEDDDALQHVR